MHATYVQIKLFDKVRYYAPICYMNFDLREFHIAVHTAFDCYTHFFKYLRGLFYFHKSSTCGVVEGATKLKIVMFNIRVDDGFSR